MMLTERRAKGASVGHQSSQREPDSAFGAQENLKERKWPQLEVAEPAIENIAISRWTHPNADVRQEEVLSPSGRYLVSIALRTTRLKLTRGSQTIFDGIMPAGTLYVGAPSKQLSAQLHAPYDFLHFHVSANSFASQSEAWLGTAEGLNDIVLLRDPFAEQLAKALNERGNSTDLEFVRCIGQTLVMHIARRELPRTKVNALPKWRLRRVEEHIKRHFDRSITLTDLAAVAGLSRMHFAAQFRAATGYRPREYILHRRIERAKSLLSNTETPLAEVALAVGFCTQAHFSTVFKRITGETPARWRYSRRNELPALGLGARSATSRGAGEPA
jgi:AraC family transcriptional regulator